MELSDSAVERIRAGRAIAITWDVDDVLAQAENNGWDVTEEQALETLARMLDNHDANHGLSWDSIDYHLTEVVNGTTGF